MVAAMAVATIIAFACQGSGSSDGSVIVEPLNDTPTANSPIVNAVDTPGRATATPPAEASINGFAFPIAGACLPDSDALLPGAPRDYRDGIHEGIDFYEAASCTTIVFDTEVLAAKAGTVVRADLGYTDLTAEELAGLESRVENGGADDPDVIDAFRGRQVWIDHGGGEVTRYAHLNGIANIAVGDTVEQGQLIAYVGESGSPESLTNPGTEVHLHFEIRIGDSYLGAGLSMEQVRLLYTDAFAS